MKAAGRSRTFVEDESAPKPTGFWKYQPQMRWLYLHIYMQVFVAFLIVSNFICNIVEKTIDPQGEKFAGIFGVFELLFNIVFTVELAINMYAFWLRRFWSSGWNVFDFVVVSIGLLTTFNVPLPGPFTLLRMMRAFRVFRLFKRVESLRKIMEALARAIPGVLNAFVILILVMCIYAILAVEFWREFGKGGHFHNEDGHEVELLTDRGQEFGFEYFGNFPKSLYTMFQVLTGESWAEAIARPLMHTPDTGANFFAAFFFASFMVVNGIILINVVVAVLLEKMTVDSAEDELMEMEQAPPVEQVEKRPTHDEDEHSEQPSMLPELSGQQLSDLDEDPDGPRDEMRPRRSWRVSRRQTERAVMAADVKRVRERVDEMKDALKVVMQQLEKRYNISASGLGDSFTTGVGATTASPNNLAHPGSQANSNRPSEVSHVSHQSEHHFNGDHHLTPRGPAVAACCTPRGTPQAPPINDSPPVPTCQPPHELPGPHAQLLICDVDRMQAQREAQREVFDTETIPGAIS